MEHTVTVVRAGRVEHRPILLSCSCGTQGDFASCAEAGEYLLRHMKNRIGNPFVVNVAENLHGQWNAEVGKLN
jgi:hypothetical protein